MKDSDSVYSENFIYAFLRAIFLPSLRPAFFKCIPSIFYNFFYCQFRSAFLPGRVPVTKVDHPLDEKIPFTPSWVTIYLDFINFWVRTVSFFLRRYRRRAFRLVADFIRSIGMLYAFAADVYKKNHSTTKRPFYIARPRFFLIHLMDPHLMCVPSLHVMVVINTYLLFADMAKRLGDEEKLKAQILEMKQGALAISQAILFVKQHSVNCIPAALYAMTCFTPKFFPPEEAEAFTEQLFSPAPPACEITAVKREHPSAAPATRISKEDQIEIKRHILTLYRRFLYEGKTAKTWEEPLVNFLREMK